MTKPPADGARSPIRDLTEEECATFRRWASAWYVVLFIALVILLTADFVRQEQERGANVAAQHAVPQLAAKASSP